MAKAMDAIEIKLALKEFKNLALDERKTLTHGEEFYDSSFARWRVSGKVKTWKRDPERVIIPAKFGLYDSYHFGRSEYMLVGPSATANLLRKVVMHQTNGWQLVQHAIQDRFGYGIQLTSRD